MHASDFTKRLCDSFVTKTVNENITQITRSRFSTSSSTSIHVLTRNVRFSQSFSTRFKSSRRCRNIEILILIDISLLISILEQKYKIDC